ncbi:MAG: hypothetical protein RXR43_15740, partial [Sulfolobus sp.]
LTTASYFNKKPYPVTLFFLFLVIKKVIKNAKVSTATVAIIWLTNNMKRYWRIKIIKHNDRVKGENLSQLRQIVFELTERH